MSKIKEFLKNAEGQVIKSYACGVEAVRNPDRKQTYKAISKFIAKNDGKFFSAGSYMALGSTVAGAIGGDALCLIGFSAAAVPASIATASFAHKTVKGVKQVYKDVKQIKAKNDREKLENPEYYARREALLTAMAKSKKRKINNMRNDVLKEAFFLKKKNAR